MSAKQSNLSDQKYTYDYFCQDNVCRLCWKISNTAKSTEHDSIADKILEYVNVKVTTTNAPKKVCLTCLNKIESFASFKKICQKNDKELRIILANGQFRKNMKFEEYTKSMETKNYPVEEFTKTTENKNYPVEEYTKTTENKNCPVVEYTKTTENKNYPVKVFLKKEVNEDEILTEVKNEENNDSRSDSSSLETKKSELLIDKDGEADDDDKYCNICNKKIGSIEKQLKHDTQCHLTKNRSYICFSCRKKFKQSSHITNHKLHCKAKYKCNFCFKIMKSEKSFQTHMKLHEEVKSTEIVSEKEVNEKPFKCCICPESFDTQEALREHDCDIEFDLEPECMCEICGKVFTCREYLARHKVTHGARTLKMRKCPYCDYRAVQLTVHIRKHTGERPYACDLCPLRCTTRANLRTHKKGHMKIKDNECLLCDKKFVHKASLKEHMSVVHNSEKHPCTECGAIYTRLSNLRRHLRTQHKK